VTLLLRSIELRPLAEPPERFPFNLACVRAFTRLDLTTPVTFLVGENGSGKSTFLEALACAAGSITVGSESVRSDPSLGPQRELAGQFKLAWSKRSQRGFFMRAEDFFGYAKKMAETRAELEQDLRAAERDTRPRSQFARLMEKVPYQSEIGALQRAYGEGLDGNSHGEGFLKLFQERFHGEGLYLLDEPEAPLSPSRQLSFLALLHRMVAQNAQFIIATHSPILMAYPGAAILTFDGGAIRPVAYDELEHVTLTRDFLNHPEAFLRHLLE